MKKNDGGQAEYFYKKALAYEKLPECIDEMIECYGKCAELEHVPGIRRFVWMQMSKKIDIQKNGLSPNSLILKAANLGDAQSQYELSRAFGGKISIDGIKMNLGNEKKWLLSAAKTGSWRAQVAVAFDRIDKKSISKKEMFIDLFEVIKMLLLYDKKGWIILFIPMFFLVSIVTLVIYLLSWGFKF